MNFYIFHFSNFQNLKKIVIFIKIQNFQKSNTKLLNFNFKIFGTISYFNSNLIEFRSQLIIGENELWSQTFHITFQNFESQHTYLADFVIALAVSKELQITFKSNRPIIVSFFTLSYIDIFAKKKLCHCSPKTVLLSNLNSQY